MKNRNQAEIKTAKTRSLAPVQKRRDHAPLPIHANRWSPLAVLAADPLGRHGSFELELDWIGDTMEPEIHQGDLVRVSERTDIRPCLNEIVLGLLKNGGLVFGAFSSTDKANLIRIAFINPDHPSVYYRENDFQWLYPIECISQLDESRAWRRIIKTIAFEAGDENAPRLLAAAA
jgi:hypothetical protein